MEQLVVQAPGGWLVHLRCNSREVFGAEGAPGYGPFRLRISHPANVGGDTIA